MNSLKKFNPSNYSSYEDIPDNEKKNYKKFKNWFVTNEAYLLYENAQKFLQWWQDFVIPNNFLSIIYAPEIQKEWNKIENQLKWMDEWIYNELMKKLSWMAKNYLEWVKRENANFRDEGHILRLITTTLLYWTIWWVIWPWLIPWISAWVSVAVWWLLWAWLYAKITHDEWKNPHYIEPIKLNTEIRKNK